MSMISGIVEAICKAIGRKKSLAQLGAELDAAAAINGEQLDWRNSIVDLLKLTGKDSSLQARKNMARELGYTGRLDGSPEMNLWLHSKVIERMR